MTTPTKQKTNKAAKYSQSETVVINRSQIAFAPYNPRKQDAEVVRKLKKNFKTVGFLGGVVWNRLTGYLVSGHKRIQTLDIINGYDGTSSTDYQIKVEAVELDDKTEREQNIFMNSPSAMGEFDINILKSIIPDIDYQAAGLNESDLNIIGISIMEEQASEGLDETMSDLKELQVPFDERKAAVKQMKAQIKANIDNKMEDMESFVMLQFSSYKAKSAFMLRFGFDPMEKMVVGEQFADMIERVE